MTHVDPTLAAVRILIAEDSPTQAQQLGYVLSRCGYETAIAANGKIALEMIRDFRPALLISDVIMPEMDGYELSRAVKEDPDLKDIPVILVTTMSDPQDVIRGLACGADNFVLKPYDEQYLLSRIRYMLANRELRRPNDVGMGVEIYFNDQRHFITADRLQILNLLLSTYDAAIQRNRELSRSQEELQNTNAHLNELKLQLEERVRERTRELERSTIDLAESEGRLRLTIETALDAVITMDDEGIIRAWNTQAETIFGWSRQEAIGQPLHQLIIPERFREAHVEGLKRYLVTGKGPFLNRRLEVSALRRDGSELPVELSIAALTLRNQSMFSSFVRDISERVAHENRIHELSRFNEMILDNVAEGIIAVGRDGALLFANPAAQTMLGWKPGQSIPDVHDSLHPDERDPSCPLRVDTGAETAGQAEATFVTSTGQRLDVRYTSATIVEDGEVTASVLTFADVTGQKRLERQLEQANRVSSLGRVAATIAHEFNNVLMGIQPLAEVVRKRSTDEKITRSATQIMGSVARGRRVTEEILRFTQPAESALQTIDLGEWLQSLTPELQGLVGRSIDLRVNNADRPVRVAADPAQLQQVLTNLVLNGRDAISDRGTICITVCSGECPAHPEFGSTPAGFVRMTVSDNGSGMTPQVRDQVFNPLFTTKRSGTGLGLAVAQQVIHAHGGSIQVESAVGKGTTFSIDLPQASSQQTTPAPVRQKHRSVPGRVLLVEDDAAVAEGVAALLEIEGVTVHILDNGGETLDAIQRFDPDCVILDISLPDVDGPEVYRRIAERRPDLPVLFSSGHGAEFGLETRGNARVGFLRKPYAFDTLLEALERITQRRPATGGTQD